MAVDTRIPYGSDVSSGTFRCVDCGQEIRVRSTTSLPPCPRFDELPHPGKAWRALSGQGDAEEDPYPTRKKG
jgi:hypothetical protein